MANPSSLPEWKLFTERNDDEALMWMIEMTGSRLLRTSTHTAPVRKTSEGDVAEFDLPIIGVIPLLNDYK